MIELLLPDHQGKFFLSKQSGVVYAEDKKTVVIYRDKTTGHWNYVISYPVFNETIIAKLDGLMGA